MAIQLHITDDEGRLLGTVTTTKAELRKAKNRATAARELVESIAAQAGVR